MSSKIGAVARKELSAFFSSPIAFIFIGTFLFVSMFIFFWVESFFARNITDVRPLFEWMPVLLIFLVSSLTMRQWSEERRMGTIEFLLTMPVQTKDLVLGKFFACLMLVGLALLLTVGVPISVAFIGNLDWGPVIGAYLASVLLAGAYIAIGLFVSSRSESQITSLIVSILICFAFYLIGSGTLVDLVGNYWGEIFRLVGTGSRFESINRGMIDFRDLYYYLSLIGVFLALNIFTLQKLKWADGTEKKSHSLLSSLTLLLVLNFLVANIWLYRATFVRVDLTEGNQYSISKATTDVLNRLQEPLLIRGYFSAKTHPLLAPLVPQIRDMIKEYGIAGGDQVKTEFIDPRNNPEIEEEANRKYNIKPMPFQIADRYQQSLVNSYFNILIQYGDKFEILSFRDLIEVKASSSDGMPDVELRNIEYDLTRSIKKVMYGFRTTESLFASLKDPVMFTGYLSSHELLPEKLAEFRGTIETLLEEYKANADGKFQYQILDPAANNSAVAKEIEDKYGFQPMVTGLFDANPFFFYMLLQSGNEVVQVSLPENFSEEGARQSLESSLKRFSPGFLKTVGMVTPPVQTNPMMMQAGLGGRQFSFVQQTLEQSHSIEMVDLQNGLVPGAVDLLLVLAPENLDDKALYSIDQFLMKGGTVAVSSAPFGITQTQNEIKASKHESGISEWLKHNGVTFEEKMVYDTSNEPYPVPVRRDLGGFSVEEIKLVNFPPNVDVRGDSIAKHGITSGLQQLTMNWTSPVSFNSEDKSLNSTTLLSSSPESWLTADTNIQPDYRNHPQNGFAIQGEQKSYPLAVLVEGSFESFFKGKSSPLLEDSKEKDQEAVDGEEQAESQEQYVGTIERSAKSARLIVFASNEFLNDQTLRVSAGSGTGRYMNSLQLVQNVVDWSLEDPALLTIRNPGHFSRTLPPMTDNVKMFWEYGNYIFALIGLIIVFVISKSIKAQSEVRYAGYLKA